MKFIESNHHIYKIEPEYWIIVYYTSNFVKQILNFDRNVWDKINIEIVSYCWYKSHSYCLHKKASYWADISWITKHDAITEGSSLCEKWQFLPETVDIKMSYLCCRRSKCKGQCFDFTKCVKIHDFSDFTWLLLQWIAIWSIYPRRSCQLW